MKRFLIKVISFIAIFFIVSLLILFIVPIDRNDYLCEYTNKVDMLKTVNQPRIIFIGGSNVAYDIDSKTLSDSLDRRVVNFGLHGGVGIRFPMEDCLQYIRKGDVVVLQFEYPNFFGGENGNTETFLPFMMSNKWRNIGSLNRAQWTNIIAGLPRETLHSLVRLMKYPKNKSFNTPSNSKTFAYTKSGFNDFGDEVSHFNYENKKYVPSNSVEDGIVNESFIEWLDNTILLYENAGAKVIMLPPVCVHSHYITAYNENVSKALNSIDHPYLVNPEFMTVDDSCSFNTGYHLNKEGVKQTTKKIIDIFRNNNILEK